VVNFLKNQVFEKIAFLSVAWRLVIEVSALKQEGYGTAVSR
jgi:hypothetical protein